MDDFVQKSADHLQYEHRSTEVELTLVDIVMFLWRYRFLVATCMILGAGLAVLYVIAATPIFTAKAQVLIESRMPVTFREQVSETIATLDTPAVESQLAILLSENIAEKVVRRAGFLDIRPEEEPGFSLNPFAWIRALLAAVPTDPATGTQAETARLREASAYLWSGMEVGRLGLSHVIEISYSSSDRDLAAKVANLIADSYIEDQLETRAETARQGSIWLEKRIDTLRQQMNEAGLRVKEFKAKRDYRFPTSSGQSEARTEPPTVGEEQPATSLEDLESRASTYRKIYESYLQAYTESVQAQSYPVTNTRIITRATRPNGRSSPRGMKVLVIAVGLGCMFGVGMALLLHSFGRSRLARA